MSKTLRLARIRAGISQQKLSQASGVSGVTISRMENGYLVKEETFNAICVALGIDPASVTDARIFNAVRDARRNSGRAF